LDFRGRNSDLLINTGAPDAQHKPERRCPKTTTRHKGTRTMKKIAIALTALSLFAAPALAESIHHDGPYSGFASAQTTTQSTSGDFGATVTGSGTSGNSGKVLITVGEDLNR
jgi:hypothetical protein